MLTLSYPWVLLLVLLPPVVRRIARPYRAPRQALRVPWFERMAATLRLQPDRGAVVTRVPFITLLAFWFLWTLLVVALARPQYLEPPVSRITPTRDLLLLVDLSGSMEVEDFTSASGEKVDRLSAVKEVLDDFLARREGDRVGLVVFGNAAFVQVPFTQDLNACRQLLDETAARMAGPRTSFGDAIGLGITLFERSDVERRVMIALTDGNDTGSKVPPAEAARIARDNGVILHVVGVGDATTTGEDELDEVALQAIAETTGGRYFYAADRDELDGIYRELDSIDEREVETETYRPRTDLFFWPLAAFLLFGGLLHGGQYLRAARAAKRSAHV